MSKEIEKRESQRSKRNGVATEVEQQSKKERERQGSKRDRGVRETQE